MHYRAVWISDVHLGTKHSQVHKLLEFLRETECDYLYIVGDLLDGWQLRRKWYWADEYNVLIQKLLRKNRKHTKVIFIPGNHDEFLEKFVGINFGSVRLVERAIHFAADGKRYLVIHGHQFDGLTQFNRVLERLGSALYDRILDLNVWINRIRRMLGFGYWSFASYVKQKAKGAVKYVTDYEEAMVQFARKNGMAGIICGHIHRPEIRQIGDMVYMNCGDWIENCTALVEDFDGKFGLIKYHENNVVHPGRGPGSHDTSDRREGDGREGGAPDRERGAGRGAESDGAPVLHIGNADADRRNSHDQFHVQE
ncbi:MAG: UDP-2,3-diacylglucosamine hydrolase [Verrucomicrobia bacterium]|nr:MAG: UDP-2,3-diacylglucosamine hydrolase [Verrucomicrobiota bacterium]